MDNSDTDNTEHTRQRKKTQKYKPTQKTKKMNARELYSSFGHYLKSISRFPFEQQFGYICEHHIAWYVVHFRNYYMYTTWSRLMRFKIQYLKFEILNSYLKQPRENASKLLSFSVANEMSLNIISHRTI